MKNKIFPDPVNPEDVQPRFNKAYKAGVAAVEAQDPKEKFDLFLSSCNSWEALFDFLNLKGFPHSDFELWPKAIRDSVPQIQHSYRCLIALYQDNKEYYAAILWADKALAFAKYRSFYHKFYLHKYAIYKDLKKNSECISNVVDCIKSIRELLFIPESKDLTIDWHGITKLLYDVNSDIQDAYLVDAAESIAEYCPEPYQSNLLLAFCMTAKFISLAKEDLSNAKPNKKKQHKQKLTTLAEGIVHQYDIISSKTQGTEDDFIMCLDLQIRASNIINQVLGTSCFFNNQAMIDKALKGNVGMKDQLTQIMDAFIFNPEPFGKANVAKLLVAFEILFILIQEQCAPEMFKQVSSVYSKILTDKQNITHHIDELKCYDKEIKGLETICELIKMNIKHNFNLDDDNFNLISVEIFKSQSLSKFYPMLCHAELLVPIWMKVYDLTEITEDDCNQDFQNKEQDNKIVSSEEIKSVKHIVEPKVEESKEETKIDELEQVQRHSITKNIISVFNKHIPHLYFEFKGKMIDFTSSAIPLGFLSVKDSIIKLFTGKNPQNPTILNCSAYIDSKGLDKTQVEELQDSASRGFLGPNKALGHYGVKQIGTNSYEIKGPCNLRSLATDLLIFDNKCVLIFGKHSNHDGAKNCLEVKILGGQHFVEIN